jgi:lipopolysaccharide/colanic/teichoic acid biosynthesis glycosyltransferase
VLRRYKLDEITQLLNVWRGEMSFVGPRPDLPSQARDYNSVARERLRVKPGMTGLVQVSGNAQLTWDERFELDAWYVRNRSFMVDLKILLATPVALLRGESKLDDPLGVRKLLARMPLVANRGST